MRLEDLDPLRVYAPESYAAFDVAVGHVNGVLPGALAAGVERRVFAGLGLSLESPGNDDDGLQLLVDQFVVYSPGIGDLERERAVSALPDGLDLLTFLHATYVIDQVARLRLVLGGLFPSSDGAAAEPATAQPASDIASAVREMCAAGVRLSGVDAVTTELVRLRVADYHRCRVCGAVRLASAAEAGADEALLSLREDFEASELSAAYKAALRLADVYITAPGDIGPLLASEIRDHFTDGQIVELLLDVSGFSLHKVRVALELDAPPREGPLVLSYDDRGYGLVS
jgi:AhpD family alkylhydroperoxidase